MVVCGALVLIGVMAASNPQAAFEQYAAGEHMAAVTGLKAIGSDRDVVRVFERTAKQWVSPDPKVAPLRRRVAAALALELSAQELQHWTTYRPLLDWSAQQLRIDPPSAFEAAWLRAAAALGFRTRDRYWLLNARFLPRAVERYPRDPRLRYLIAAARLMGSYSVIWTAAKDDDREMMRLTADPMVGVEAELRLAELRLGTHEFDRALDHARKAQPRATDPALVYLARFIAGRALEGMGQSTDAAREYAAALDAIPNAQSATLALAAIQASAGEGAPALRRVERSFSISGRAEREDPWRLLPYGEFRILPALVRTLREALR